MTEPEDEFIIGETRAIQGFVRQQRCVSPSGRAGASPMVPVHYLHFPEQRRGIAEGSTLYVVGFDSIDHLRRDVAHLHVVVHSE
jgi:hypothetical protein